MRSIGEMARDSGLGVSALRFYDRAGVLVPAWVDPVSGYRWYEPEQLAEARLLAALRRAGMPLADIRLVLAGWAGPDPDLVRGLLRAHLRRLERGLSDARTEFSALRSLLDRRENPMTSLRTAVGALSVAAPALAAALDAVRFAVGTDPGLPVLGGVLFDAEGDRLRVVATDRYRLAVAQAPVTEVTQASATDVTQASATGAAHASVTGHHRTRMRVVVPAPLADAMRALLTGEEPVRLTADGDRVTLETGDRQTAGQCLAHDFPDYRRLTELPSGRRALVDVAGFRQALEAGPVRGSEAREEDGVSCDLSVLRVADDGTVLLCGEGDDAPDRVAVNREFLLQALTAGARDRLILEVGAPTAPLAIRRPDGPDGPGDEGAFSLLMPVRLED
ncbi:MerR family transcriptional regulator [Streptomyces sp. HMX87]|uniref:DNA polymerase III subunit beta family protein n=1 Tax=Streptomyces sp. HMX87 TaxID=3390849 RepID=UPI003A88C527